MYNSNKEMLIPIKDVYDFKKDKHTDSVINTNINEYESFLKKKKFKKDTEKRLSQLESKLDSIESLLQQLVTKNG